jgi:hypothetical protein
MPKGTTAAICAHRRRVILRWWRQNFAAGSEPPWGIVPRRGRAARPTCGTPITVISRP